MDYEAYETVKLNIYKMDFGLIKEILSIDFEEDNLVILILIENNEGLFLYFVGYTECNEDDEEYLFDRFIDYDIGVVIYFIYDEGDF